jgi:hypothetical protein
MKLGKSNDPETPKGRVTRSIRVEGANKINDLD